MKRIVLTRPKPHNDVLAHSLGAKGLAVLELPLIEVRYDAQAQVLQDVFETLGEYQWLIFTSAHGVEAFFHYFFQHFKDIRCLGLLSIACVGQATADALRTWHLQPDFVPKTATAHALGVELIEQESLEHAAILIVQGNRNSPELAKMLEDVGLAIVDTLPAYTTEPRYLQDTPEAADFLTHGAHSMVFCSPSSVEAFVKLSLHPGAQFPYFVSIGPSTSQALKDHQLPIHAQAKTPSSEALHEAILEVL